MDVHQYHKLVRTIVLVDIPAAVFLVFSAVSGWPVAISKHELMFWLGLIAFSSITLLMIAGIIVKHGSRFRRTGLTCASMKNNSGRYHPPCRVSLLQKSVKRLLRLHCKKRDVCMVCRENCTGDLQARRLQIRKMQSCKPLLQQATGRLAMRLQIRNLHICKASMR
jgi:hypothetical protein